MVRVIDESGVLLGHLSLAPHPSTPARAVAGVWCNYSWENADRWVISFGVDAPYSALRLSEVIDFSRADELWRTTCFELFLRRPGEDAYLEFNFAPSGQWAAYGFNAYRVRGVDPQGAGPIIFSPVPGQTQQAHRIKMVRMGVEPDVAARLTANDDSLGQRDAPTFVVMVQMEDAGINQDGPWEIAVSAVIEEADGAKSYWALAHPSDKPDFHHPDSFVLELP